MPEPTRAWIDDGTGPVEIHGIRDVKVIESPTAFPREVAIDLGLIRLPRKPTPIERALTVLHPHLERCPLYDA